ncbi:hypothetical protein PR048_001871 [Dryococelus australis]|uniref:NYN domain-containing protein n=1 Tax=Dryococelus australis TaxID=614101 RepID=A0ABQ9IJA3_9NEOP|nr:hypothetical protein PR048_001871 [Dryococelus australis]
MQLIQEESYPGRSSFVFLPMIDMDLTNLSCVYSTLKILCAEANRHGVNPVVTFDQAIWWKAQVILNNEPLNSEFKDMVLVLGAFHTLMNFIGCVRHLMTESGFALNFHTGICYKYVLYVKRNFNDPEVVFDGYDNNPSIKDETHYKRSRGKEIVTIVFSEEMSFHSKKDNFFRSKPNKQQFIHLLSEHLVDSGCEVKHAKRDDDLLIAESAVQYSKEKNTLVIGEDIDLLVLLSFYSEMESKQLYFISSDKNSSHRKVWDKQKMKKVLGEEISSHVFFIHAVGGYDCTSRLFDIDKGTVQMKLLNDALFLEQVKVFSYESTDKDKS